MFYLVLGLIILGMVAMVAGIIRNRRLQQKLEKGEIDELPSVKQVQDMECCGQHEVCEKESLLAALSKEIEYYNDEELDRFQGKESDAYTDEEEEEFRDVLYTMREDEVAGWVGLRNEVIMIVGDLRGM